MEKDYDRICKAAPEFKSMASLKDFMITRALVNSRIFGIKIDGIEDDSIVPYADMFNYKYMSDMTHWTFSAESSAFVIKSKHAIKAGEEIFVYYGNKPNSNFFQFYGFVVDNNDNDEVCFKVAVSPSDRQKLQAAKKEAAKRKFKVSAKTKSLQFEQLMSYLRFVVFEGTAEELKSVGCLLIVAKGRQGCLR